MEPKIYKIKGMHCVSCASTIEKKLNKTAGVQSASVSYATESAEVSHDVPLENLNKAISPLGYALIPEEGKEMEKMDGMEDMSKEEHSHMEHNMDFKILRQNVIISIPIVIASIFVMVWDIFGGSKYISAMPGLAENLFKYVMPILATYMLFVVGKPYLMGFWRFLRYGHANMDTLIGIGTFTAYIYSLAVVIFADKLVPYIDVETTYYDVAIIVIGFITLGKFLEARAKSRTNEALKALVSLQAKSAIVRRNGKDEEISLDMVVVNDLVVIKPGAKVPVDGVVVEGESFVDESMITGEPMPAEKNIGRKVVAGTINQDGFIIVKATSVGKDSLLSHIINLVKTAQSSRAPIQKLADKISSIFVPIVLAVAFLSLIGWIFIGGRFMPFNNALALGITSFVGVLVIACPCALGLATPTAIIVGVGKGARNGILIKNAEALEKLSKVRHIVFDKTGTITEGRPEVIRFVNASKLPDVEIIGIAASLDSLSGHPIARAIMDYAKNKKAAILKVGHYYNYKGKGASAEISREIFFIGNEKLILEKSGVKADKNLIEGELVRALTPVVLAGKNEILGYFFIGDSVKKEAKEAMRKFHSYRVKTHMATGDQEQAAAAVAKEVGVDEFHARLLPEDKQIIIRDLKKDGAMVAMVGDGVNDAPAMALADVGIAMATGTDVAIETADITLLHGDISKVAKSVQLSKETLRTIKQNLFWAFAFNVIGIPLAAGVFYSFGFTLNPAFAGAAMAFSSVLVVSNSLRLKLGKL